VDHGEPLVRKDGIIAGVCAAIARRFGMSVTLVRVLYVVLSVVSAAFPGILVYLLLWFLIPKERGHRKLGEDGDSRAPTNPGDGMPAILRPSASRGDGDEPFRGEARTRLKQNRAGENERLSQLAEESPSATASSKVIYLTTFELTVAPLLAV